MLRNVRLPNNIVMALSTRFQVKKEDGRPLSPEKRSGRVLHSFLAHLASGLDPVPSFEQMGLLQVDPDGTVYVLFSMFSVPVDL